MINGRPAFTMSAIWQQTLAERPDDPYAIQREHLRSEFVRFRDRATTLAREINRDLPDFTVHDETHLDALWSFADLVGPKEHLFSPLEGFVLGGAFLVHDLGMGAAAYPEAKAELPRLALWRVARRVLGIAKPDAELTAEEERRLKAYVLRELHAERAAILPTQEWSLGGNRYHLIEDPVLREQLGPMIGSIASSHWWPFEKVVAELDSIVGPPAGFPVSWRIDKLLLAALVRAADAAHLDALRAPSFLFALRHLSGISEQHWTFQNKLLFPQLDGDRLLYSSSSSFSIEDADAWWLCYDAINLVHRELVSIDDFLSRQHVRPSFAARGVIGADDPQSLSLSIHIDGWLAVDTRPRIADVGRLIERLGGRALYGENFSVPIREILQNCIDAYSALTILEPKLPPNAMIDVAVVNVAGRYIISIGDNGVGMSAAVVLGYLLNFGESLWSSPAALRTEFPLLAEKSLRPMGRWGIGFFSVFMLADKVTVFTRRYQVGAEAALALEFRDGLRQRPILRHAASAESPYPCGTRIVIELTPLIVEKLRSQALRAVHEWFSETIRLVAPFVPATIVDRSTSSDRVLVDGVSWRDLKPERLLERIRSSDRNVMDRYIDVAPETLSAIVEDDGTVVGRAALVPYDEQAGTIQALVISSGGIRLSAIPHCVGVFLGEPTRAARDTSKVLATWDAVRRWATNQRHILARFDWDLNLRLNLAAILHSLDTDTADLPVVVSADGPLSVAQLRAWIIKRDFIILTHDFHLPLRPENNDRALLDPNVLIVDSGIPSIRQMLKDNIRVTPGIPVSYFSVEDYAASLEGLVYRLTSESWRINEKRLRARSLISERSRRVSARVGVGRLSGSDAIVDRVDVLKRESTVSVPHCVIESV
jgi:Histidine kinase-, DNA gyrase B-, and HSP90-like ATPase